MASAHRQIDASQEIERVIRLRQIAIDSKRVQHVDVGIENGRATDQNLLGGKVDPDLPADVDAAKDRQIEVEKDDIERPMRRIAVECLSAVGGFDNLEVFGTQELRDQ